MLKVSKYLFNCVVSCLDFEDYCVLETVCKNFNKKLNDINQYKKYKSYLKKIMSKHLTYEYLMLEPNDVFLEDKYFSHIFHHLRYLKASEKISIKHKGDPDVFTFSRLKLILNSNKYLLQIFF